MGKLLEKRILFSRTVALLLVYATAQRYDWILDQCLRTKREARWNSEHCAVMIDGRRCEENPASFVHGLGSIGTHVFRSIGIERSMHRSGLAVDLYLITDGMISQNAGDYMVLGDYWKSLHPDARWGGDFTFADLGHFSFEHKGRA